ncbi:hypothetical protein SVAN01_07337 [Stagonosporopsis vannaccii]|nr:hypothetical protein SVAN01_07337 [Stagonosporopsis vannaccii]
MATKSPFDPVQPIHWVLDWDGTITRHDTLDALVSITASAKPVLPVLAQWRTVSEAYMSDYTTALEKLAPGGNLPRNIVEEQQLLRAMKSVEQASLDRVSSSGIFAGLTKRLLEEGARNVVDSKKVEIRTGFTDFLHSIQEKGRDRLDLLSVNWSRHFIGSCLKAAEALVQKEVIHANELDGIDNDSVSLGHISHDNDAEMLIISSGDKLEYMNRLRKQHSNSRDRGTNSDVPIVYIGDSWTDIECLLDADLGICIRDEPLGSSQKKLAERLESLSIRCPHLSAWSDADGQQVVWASDFAEIKTWIGARQVSKR